MSDSSSHTGRRETGRLIIFLVLGLFLLAWLFWFGADLLSKHGLERYEQQREAMGEHFNFADFIPKPVLDESNFALAPIVAGGYEEMMNQNGRPTHSRNGDVDDPLVMEIYGGKSRVQTPDGGNWALGQPTDLKAFQRYYRSLAQSGDANAFPVAPQPQSPAADVLLALSRYDEPIEELRQAAALPDSRFPLNYHSDPPAGILLPHLAELKGPSQVLELRAVSELQNGQNDAALADVELMLRLMASVRDEPFLISHLVRVALLNLALQPVWEGTQAHRWTDSQLKELDRDLAGLDFLADYQFCMRGECAIGMADMDYFRRTRKAVMDYGAHTMPSALELELRFGPDSIYYHNESVFARAFQEWILPIVDVRRHTVSLKAARVATTNLEAMDLNLTVNNVLAATSLFYGRSLERFSHAQSCVNMARLAIALERYRLVHSIYPETLKALTPDFIESIPHDIIGGKPLKYHRSSGGRFVLYSVGWNGSDDGGKIAFLGASKTSIDYEKGDWVWAGEPQAP
ncbi:MAG: hypothetical protein ACREFR_18660 [Limisphaerales bacterium]